MAQKAELAATAAMGLRTASASSSYNGGGGLTRESISGSSWLDMRIQFQREGVYHGVLHACGLCALFRRGQWGLYAVHSLAPRQRGCWLCSTTREAALTDVHLGRYTPPALVHRCCASLQVEATNAMLAAFARGEFQECDRASTPTTTETTTTITSTPTTTPTTTTPTTSRTTTPTTTEKRAAITCKSRFGKNFLAVEAGVSCQHQVCVQHSQVYGVVLSLHVHVEGLAL